MIMVSPVADLGNGNSFASARVNWPGIQLRFVGVCWVWVRVEAEIAVGRLIDDLNSLTCFDGQRARLKI